jgi:hypothetical protein
MDGLMYHKGLARGAAACCIQTHKMVKGKLIRYDPRKEVDTP